MKSLRSYGPSLPSTEKGARQPWFVAKPLAKAKDLAGAMHNIVAPIKGRTMRYFRDAPRPERAHREAHKDFAWLNTRPVHPEDMVSTA